MARSSAARNPSTLRLSSRRVPQIEVSEGHKDVTPIRLRVVEKTVKSTVERAGRFTYVQIADWEERGGEHVYVNIAYTDAQDAAGPLEFAGPMRAEDLDEMVEMLIAVRSQARTEGVLR